jgi:hypothetical protein
MLHRSSVLDNFCAVQYIGDAPLDGAEDHQCNRPPTGREGLQMPQNFEDIQKIGKTNLDASMKSFGAVSKGFQTIAVETADYAKKAFEQGTSATERLATAKSLDKVLEVQTDYLKTAYEGFVAQSAKIGQLYADLAQETYKSFESQWTKVPVTK